ncbi:MAG: Trk system potassium transporter TrkA [Candidatus Sumerlaeia bacterium]
MNIIVIGAGTVGSTIADLLVSQGHNLTVIDTEAARLRELEDRLDLSTLAGSGASPQMLWMAGVNEADLVLAMTNNDEVNLLSAQVGRRLGARRTVARVKKHEYLFLRGSFNLGRELGIDLVISPEQLTAAEIAAILADPDMPAFGHFAQEQVQLRHLTLADDSPFVGKTVKELGLPQGLLLVLIVRGEEIIIPRGDATLQAGDKVSFLGLTDAFKKDGFGEERSAPMRRVWMAGGGEIGFYLATMLERMRLSVKLIDIDRKRCEELSESLNRTEILVGDVTDRRFLEEERIHTADVFVAVTGDEETNIMSSMLAKQLGVPFCITKVDRPDYAKVIEKIGIDRALSPRLIAAEKILRLIKGRGLKALSLLEEGKVEVMELEVMDKAPIIQRPLSELFLPRECLVAMIVRQGKVKVPRGQDQIHPGDSLIVIARTDAVDKLDEFLNPEA